MVQTFWAKICLKKLPQFVDLSFTSKESFIVSVLAEVLADFCLKTHRIKCFAIFSLVTIVGLLYFVHPSDNKVEVFSAVLTKLAALLTVQLVGLLTLIAAELQKIRAVNVFQLDDHEELGPMPAAKLFCTL